MRVPAKLGRLDWKTGRLQRKGFLHGPLTTSNHLKRSDPNALPACTDWGESESGQASANQFIWMDG